LREIKLHSDKEATWETMAIKQSNMKKRVKDVLIDFYRLQRMLDDGKGE